MRRYRIEFDTGTRIGVLTQHARGIGDALNKIELKMDVMPEMQRVTLIRIDAEPPEAAPVAEGGSPDGP